MTTTRKAVSSPPEQKPDVVIVSMRSEMWPSFSKAASKGSIIRGDKWSARKNTNTSELYLFWFCAPDSEIRAIGIPHGETMAGGSGDYYSHFDPCLLLENPIRLADIEKDATLAAWWATKPYQGRPRSILKAHSDAANCLLSLIAARNPDTREAIEEAGFSTGKARVPASIGKPKERSSLIELVQAMDEDEQERLRRFVEVAIRDAELRPAVIEVWGKCCAACGLELIDRDASECEVAHIRPVFEGGLDKTNNALPLCRTHHWAFDRFLWTFGTDLKIRVHWRFHKTEPLRALHGKSLILPDPSVKSLLAKTNIEWRLARFKEAERKFHLREYELCDYLHYGNAPSFSMLAWRKNV